MTERKIFSPFLLREKGHGFRSYSLRVRRGRRPPAPRLRAVLKHLCAILSAGNIPCLISHSSSKTDKAVFTSAVCGYARCKAVRRLDFTKKTLTISRKCLSFYLRKCSFSAAQSAESVLPSPLTSPRAIWSSARVVAPSV